MPFLARLSEGNNGVFSMGSTIMVIDGLTKPQGNVGPMLYFAPVFSRETQDNRDEYDTVVDTNGRILLLAKYLESIQKPAESASD